MMFANPKTDELVAAILVQQQIARLHQTTKTNRRSLSIGSALVWVTMVSKFTRGQALKKGFFDINGANDEALLANKLAAETLLRSPRCRSRVMLA